MYLLNLGVLTKTKIRPKTAESRGQGFWLIRTPKDKKILVSQTITS
jgi:hypothetical protein